MHGNSWQEAHKEQEMCAGEGVCRSRHQVPTFWPGPASTGGSVWEERRLICTAWERERGNLYSYDKSDPQRQQQPGPGQVTDRWWSVVRAEQSSILGSGSSRGKYSDCGPAY